MTLSQPGIEFSTMPEKNTTWGCCDSIKMFHINFWRDSLVWPARDSTPQNQDFVDLKLCKIHCTKNKKEYSNKNREVSSCFSHQNNILVCFYCPTHLHLAKFALSDSSCEKPWQRCHWSIVCSLLVSLGEIFQNQQGTKNDLGHI